LDGGHVSSVVFFYIIQFKMRVILFLLNCEYFQVLWKVDHGDRC
jgi:hypothetical protein